MDNGNIKTVIDLSLDRAALLLSKGNKLYKRIIYSCDEYDRSRIGTGVFKNTLGRDVVDYISKGIGVLQRANSHTRVQAIVQKNLSSYFALLIEDTVVCEGTNRTRRKREA